MLSIPPYFLLIPYALFMLGYLFFSVANIVSLSKYGARNAIGLVASFIFVAGTAVIILMTWRSLASIDWFSPIPLTAIPTITF